MSKRTIVALPGDGIGKVVLDEAIKVLDAAGFEANYVVGDIGWEFWRNEGNPLPNELWISLLNIKSDYSAPLHPNPRMKHLMS